MSALLERVNSMRRSSSARSEAADLDAQLARCSVEERRSSEWEVSPVAAASGEDGGAPFSDAAASVLRLQAAERAAPAVAGASRGRGDAAYAKLWLELFLRVGPRESRRLRCALAGNLCFRRRDGAHLDVEFARRHLSPADDARLIAHLRHAAERAPRKPGSYAVVSDVDDTMTPGGYGALGVAGTDTTAPEGSFFPGCAQLHRELGGPAGYSTLLTARPPPLVRSMIESARGAELLRAFGPRIALLPGASAAAEVGTNLKNILVAGLVRRRRGPWRSLAEYAAHARRRFSGLADHKTRAFASYAACYPDFAGAFCFLGDDAQGDYLVARDLLRLNDARGAPLLAWCAVKHARKRDGAAGDALTPAVQVEMLRDARRESGDRRFFIFESYHDLAAQLHAADWIPLDAKNRVVEASVEEGLANDFFG